FLSTRTWVDLRKGVEDPRAAQLLINAIRGIPLGPDRSVEPRADICPYRGLQPFDEEQAEFFFGRDGDIQRLIEKLKATRFLAVIGPSGSGKSSLVRAGLIPALRQGGLPISQTWKIRLLTPGARPLETLALHLSALISGDDPVGVMRNMEANLRADERALHLAMRLALTSSSFTKEEETRVVLVIDQFEEIFTLCHDEQERRQFLANVLYGTSIPDGRSLVILTLRAGFYPRCAAYPDLAARIAAQQCLVSPMDVDGLLQVIEEPAQRVGLEFEEGLVGTILEDVANQPGTLPLLEHALLELWERRRGRILTLEGYWESGEVERAIAKRADTIYTAFTSDQQARARQILLRLTQPGEGTEDTRRRAAMSELVPRPSESDAVEGVVRALVDARLLTMSGDERTGGERAVDVSHEALIRGWPRLRQWIDEDRAALRVHRRLTEAVHEWQRLGRDEEMLYRGARLAEAVEWRERNEAALNELEREFLNASVGLQIKERRAAQRRVQLTVGGLITALVLISIFAFIAFHQSRIADQQRDAALKARDAAEQSGRIALSRLSRELAMISTSQLLIDPELSALLAIEAARVMYTEQAENALRQVLLKSHMRAVLHGHKDAVENVAFSPDGKFITTASRDKTARVWEVATGQSLAILRGHEDAVESAAFSPDGKLVVTASKDNTAWVWEVATGQSLAILRGHEGMVQSAAFSPDGQFVITAGWDKTARVWEVATWQNLAVLRGHEDMVVKATFSFDNKFIVTASEDNTARVWEVATWQSLAILRGHKGAVESAVFSPNGKLVVTASGDNTARLWEVATGQSLVELQGHTDWVRSTAFSPDGKFIATASWDGTARLWEVATRQSLAILHEHEGAVSSAAFSPDGKLIVTAGRDKTVRLWDVATRQSLAVLRGHEDVVESAAFSPDGKLIVTTGWDKTVRLWDVATRQNLAILQGHESAVGSAAFSPDGKLIVTASGDDTAQIYTCEVCGSIEDLLALARARVTRELTQEEREKYLHEPQR
ncbi:MAG: hypothetical protein HY670_04215, partial [Chloroflexi bacterium]|nr:hypothetical protein [Chloroflexota bacterium]